MSGWTPGHSFVEKPVNDAPVQQLQAKMGSNRDLSAQHVIQTSAAVKVGGKGK